MSVAEEVSRINNEEIYIYSQDYMLIEIIVTEGAMLRVCTCGCHRFFDV